MWVAIHLDVTKMPCVVSYQNPWKIEILVCYDLAIELGPCTSRSKTFNWVAKNSY